MVRNIGNKLTNGASLCDGGAPLISFWRLLHLLCFFWLSTFDSITVVRPSVLWYQDENIWLTQKMMAALHNVSVVAISQHICGPAICSRIGSGVKALKQIFIT